jgi:integration host factor subunit beta
MLKSELIESLAKRHPHLAELDVEKMVKVFFDEIATAMARGDRVELRGFGTFSVNKRGARTARNPRTGENVNVQEKMHMYFKTGKWLHEKLNKLKE